MDNRTRAANIIAHGMKNDDSPARIAKHLHDYGLIVDDPPEPDSVSRKGWPHWKLHGYGDHNYTIHVEYLAGDVFINSPACNMSARADDAAALAHIIHAAAHYPKGWAQHYSPSTTERE